MSFLATTEQFNAVFGETKTISDQLYDSILTYLKSHQYIKRLKEMYEWMSAGGEISVFKCRNDLLDDIAEKLNMEHIPFLVIADRDGKHGFMIKTDMENKAKDATKAVLEEKSKQCTIMSMQELQASTLGSKHQDKSLIAITGLSKAQMYLLEQSCMKKLNVSEIGEDYMQDGTYRFAVHGASAMKSGKQNKGLGILLLDMMFKTKGVNAEYNNQKAVQGIQMMQELSHSFHMNDGEEHPPVYITGDDNQYMKIMPQGFEYGHAVKENGQLKLIPETTIDRRLPDYDMREIAHTSRFVNPVCTTDLKEMFTNLEKSGTDNEKYAEYNKKEQSLAEVINEAVAQKTANDPIMQAQGRWASKATHVINEMGKIMTAMANGTTPAGYSARTLHDIEECMIINRLNPDDYVDMARTLQNLEIVPIESTMERISVRQNLTESRMQTTAPNKEEEEIAK